MVRKVFLGSFVFLKLYWLVLVAKVKFGGVYLFVSEVV